eukprot:5128683-Amphidinium_carterae.1
MKEENFAELDTLVQSQWVESQLEEKGSKYCITRKATSEALNQSTCTWSNYYYFKLGERPRRDSQGS